MKMSKITAHYSDGMPAHHCGPTQRWADGQNPRHTCRHFQPRTATVPINECEKVEGAIDTTGWCRYFVASKT